MASLNPLAPVLREHRSMAAIVFAVIFALVGLAVTGAALGVNVSLWTLVLIILGGAGVALLVTALVESRR